MSPEERLQRLERFAKRMAVTGRRTRNDLRTNINALIDAQMRNEHLFNVRFARLSAAQAEATEQIKELRASQAEVTVQIKELRASQAETTVEIKELLASQAETTVEIKELLASQAETTAQIKELREAQKEMFAAQTEMLKAHTNLAGSHMKLHEEVATSQKQTDERLRILIDIVGLDRNGANN
jgi:peptidoglycan hydrolase CwlO-like protein